MKALIGIIIIIIAISLIGCKAVDRNLKNSGISSKETSFETTVDYKDLVKNPVKIITYNSGESKEYFSGSEEYQEIISIVTKELKENKNISVFKTALSNEDVIKIKAEEKAVEFVYSITQTDTEGFEYTSLLLGLEGRIGNMLTGLPKGANPIIGVFNWSVKLGKYL